MSLYQILKATCDGMADTERCGVRARFKGSGDAPYHEAEKEGWRFTANGRALCSVCARRELPQTFIPLRLRERKRK